MTGEVFDDQEPEDTPHVEGAPDIHIAVALRLELIRAAVELVKLGRNDPDELGLLCDSAQRYLQEELLEWIEPPQRTDGKEGNATVLAACLFDTPQGWTFGKAYNHAKTLGVKGLLYDGVPLNFVSGEDAGKAMERFALLMRTKK